MSQTTPTKIGFLGSSAPSSPHHASFKKFIPADIDFTFMQESGTHTSLYDAQGKVDALIEQSRELIATNGWHGLILSGAPKEALNPGMWEQVTTALKVPVTLALRSSVAALKAFSARKILLMTPVDDRLKKMYYDYLAAFEIESFYPPQILRAHTDAQKLTSSDVEEMTRKALSEYPNVDAIYFQGALLDPIPVLEKLEHELKLPIVASNPAMLWLVLSKLGLRYNIAGYGDLLKSWPGVPGGPF
ncbi:MAG: aspartate racemase/maleate isomerase family protein [Candidatus Binatia bacterium]